MQQPSQPLLAESASRFLDLTPHPSPVPAIKGCPGHVRVPDRQSKLECVRKETQVICPHSNSAWTLVSFDMSDLSRFL